MTTAEIKSLYNKIIELLYQHRWKESFSHLVYLIQQNGLGDDYDKMVRQETNYRYLLRYNLESSDETRDAVLTDISENIARLADDSYRKWMLAYSNQWYYSQCRYQPDLSLEASLKALIDSDEDSRLYQDVVDKSLIVDKLKMLKINREQQVSTLFMTILLSGRWTESDQSVAEKIFAECLNENEQALAVSAFLLALQHLFDERKLLFLSSLCQSNSPEVSRRALTVFMLLLDKYDKRMAWYPTLSAKLSLIVDDAERQAAMQTIFLQLIRTKDVEQVNKRMRDEFLPEMTKLGGSIQQKMEKQELDEADSDWKELFEESSMSEKLQEFSELQAQGVDVYMSTFSSLKYYPFFKDIDHWFLPFYSSHSAISDLFESEKKTEIDIPRLVTKSDFLCSSDKYSFCFNLAQVPEEYRSQMAGNMGADSEAFQEMQKMEQSGNIRLKQVWISNRYIQDLYRFYKLFPSRKDFEDVFIKDFDFYGNSLLSVCLDGEEKMKAVAAAYMKSKHYDSALKLYQRLLEKHPGEYDYLRKEAYCYQQLQDYQAALDDYLKADLIQSDNLWTLKRIAACYRQLKQNDKALDFYRRAMSLDSENLSLCLNVAHCLVDTKNYSEAMNYYYKASFLSKESPKIWRPLAWCALLCQRYEQAEKYFQKILADCPTMVDYLNAGHLEWLKGSRIKAVEMYKKGIRQTHTSQNEFMELFEKDLPDLLELGIEASQVPIVRDGLMYLLEE